MPKVDTTGFSLDGQDYELAIYYTKTNKKFRIEGIPGVLQQKVGAPNKILADTQDEATTKLHKYLQLYVDLKETRRKVIIYRWHAMARIKDDDGNVIWQRNWMRGFSNWGTPRDVNTALGLAWRISIEVDNPVRGMYYMQEREAFGKTYEHNDRVAKEESIIPWTLEAEQFFTQFEAFLVNSIKKMDEFLGLEPEQLEQKILEAAGLLPDLSGKATE